jgi:hypothetical protein
MALGKLSETSVILQRGGFCHPTASIGLQRDQAISKKRRLPVGVAVTEALEIGCVAFGLNQILEPHGTHRIDCG